MIRLRTDMLRSEARLALIALQFLTRLPVALTGIVSPEEISRAARYYPLVGALVGSVGALCLIVAGSVLGAVASVILSTVATIALTGAFHEDGLADTADGIGGGMTAERSLEIMRDSRLGTYGTLALVLVLGLKIALLTDLGAMAGPALIAAHAFSRASSLLCIATSRYVRAEGTAKPVADGVTLPSVSIGALTAGAALVPLAVFAGVPEVLLALTGLAAGHALVRLTAHAKLGGYTGDTLGAVQQLSEAGFYLGLAAAL